MTSIENGRKQLNKYKVFIVTVGVLLLLTSDNAYEYYKK